jgi:hypothetical protein
VAVEVGEKYRPQIHWSLAEFELVQQCGGNNTLEEEIRERIVNGNKAFYANGALFKRKLVSRNSRLTLYWSVIRPVVVYGCETWVLKESIILSVFERKMLRKIFGPTKGDNGNWRIKTNIELKPKD